MRDGDPPANTDNSEDPSAHPAPWFVYMIRTTADRLYTGITTDPRRRVRQHEQGTGAKFFRLDHPATLVYLEPCPDRSSATRREMEIKRMSRRAKLDLAASRPTP